MGQGGDTLGRGYRGGVRGTGVWRGWIALLVYTPDVDATTGGGSNMKRTVKTPLMRADNGQARKRLWPRKKEAVFTGIALGKG